MALIRKAKPKTVSGGYDRVFGNKELGHLISRVQSAVISSGSELERIIGNRTHVIFDIDEFLKIQTMEDGVFIARKKDIKKSKYFASQGSEPDFVIFKRRGGEQHCHVVELKDGDTFDTKKATAEIQTLRSFAKDNAPRLPYIVKVHVCCFNQNSRDEIVKGFKSRITKDEAMTGREFCELLEIDYDKIVNERKDAVSENFSYFLSELVKIEKVQEWLSETFPEASE